MNKETGQSEDGIQSLAPGFSTNTYVWKEEIYSIAEVSILRARSPLNFLSEQTFSWFVFIFSLCIISLCLNYTSKEASFESIISSTNSWNYKMKPKVLLHYLLCLFWALPAFRQVDRKFPRIRKLSEILFRFLLAVAITITWMNRIKRTYP